MPDDARLNPDLCQINWSIWDRPTPLVDSKKKTKAVFEIILKAPNDNNFFLRKRNGLTLNTGPT